MFNELTEEEQADYRQWARDFYKPSDAINSIWHPVVRKECALINAEHMIRAMFAVSLPVNPRPFAQGIIDYVKEHGTESVESDEVKAILWSLMAMAYGQLSTIDLSQEWHRLKVIFDKGGEE